MREIYSFKKKLLYFLWRYFPIAVYLNFFIKFFFSLKAKLVKQLSSAVYRDNPKGVKVIYTMIDTGIYRFYQHLILAKALELRGAQVYVLICDEALAGCELKNNKNRSFNICLKCRFNRRHIVPLFKLKVKYLSDFITEEVKESCRVLSGKLSRHYPSGYYHKGVNIIPIVNGSVQRYFFGGIPDCPEKILKLRADHLYSTLINLYVAEKIVKTIKPSIQVSGMSAYSGWEPYYSYFKNHGVSQSILSISQYDYRAIVLNSMDVYFSQKRYENYINSRNTRMLSNVEHKKLMLFLRKRTSGKTEEFYRIVKFDEGKDIESLLKIDKTKKNIFLFSNLFWDLGLSEMGGVFDSVKSWVLTTVQFLKDKKDIRLYIKTHPAEKYDSNPSEKGVESTIREAFSNGLPDNVFIISPEMHLSPYVLLKYSDLNVLYTGTLGLESLLLNPKIPVLIVGKAPYCGLGFTHEPTTICEYKKLLLTLQRTKPSVSVDESVKLFAYFYFIKMLIPWRLTEKVYADNFQGFAFDDLDSLTVGRDKYLDHLCSCILKPDETIPEAW